MEKLALLGCISVVAFHFLNKGERKNMKITCENAGKTCMHLMLLESTLFMEMSRVFLLHNFYIRVSCEMDNAKIDFLWLFLCPRILIF